MNSRNNLDYTINKENNIIITIDNENILKVYLKKNGIIENDDIFKLEKLKLILNVKIKLNKKYAYKRMKKQLKIINLIEFKRQLHNYNILDNTDRLIAFYFIKDIEKLIEDLKKGEEK